MRLELLRNFLFFVFVETFVQRFRGRKTLFVPSTNERIIAPGRADCCGVSCTLAFHRTRPNSEMFLANQLAPTAEFVLAFSSISGMLNNILSTGGFQTAVLFHDNRSEAFAVQLLGQRLPSSDCVVFNIDESSSSVDQLQMDTSALRRRSNSTNFLVVSVLNDTESIPLWLSRMRQWRFALRTRSLTIVLGQIFEEDKMTMIKSVLQHSVNVGLMFWNAGYPQLLNDNVLVFGSMAEVESVRDLSRMSAQTLFSKSRTQARLEITLERRVHLFSSLKDIDDFIDFARSKEVLRDKLIPYAQDVIAMLDFLESSR